MIPFLLIFIGKLCVFGVDEAHPPVGNGNEPELPPNNVERSGGHLQNQPQNATAHNHAEEENPTPLQAEALRRADDEGEGKPHVEAVAYGPQGATVVRPANEIAEHLENNRHYQARA